MSVRMQRHLGSVLNELRHEPVRTRVRAFLGGQAVLDTERAVLVWEPRRVVPMYAAPVADLDARLEPLAEQPGLPDLDGLPPVLGPESFEPHTSTGLVADLVAELVSGPVRRERAAYLLGDDDLGHTALLDFAAFEEWRVEDEELVGHPRDPFKRIDVLTTSRPVRVSLDGVVLAETTRALMLLETPLPVTRLYLPAEDVRTDLLVDSPTRSTCAYKGHASYLSTADGSEAGRDVAWTYPAPLDDALRVRDRICFWAERTDLEVDGQPQARPLTPWTPPEELRRHLDGGGALDFA